MTDEQRQRVHDLLYSTEARDELCEKVVLLEDENERLDGFWTADDTWHTERPKAPEAIAVRLPDGTMEQYDRVVES